MKVQAIGDYRRCKISVFEVIINAILNGLYKNITTFVTPPVLKVNYQAAYDAYNTARGNFVAGGKGFKAAYTSARVNLIIALDKLLEYVNALPGLTDTIIGESGFTAYKHTSKSTIPLQAIGLAFYRLGGNTMQTACNTVVGTANYSAILVEGSPLPDGYLFNDGLLDLPAGTNPRIRFNVNPQNLKTWANLIEKNDYYLYYYTTNTAGVSVLSDSYKITFSNN